MNWFFAVLPLLGLTVASATIPRLVPAVRDQRTAIADGRLRANGHGRLPDSAGRGSARL